MDAQVPIHEISDHHHTHTEIAEGSDSDHDQASDGSHWQSTYHDDIDPVPLTLPVLCIAIHDWQMEWEPEADWDHNFNLALW